MFVDELSRRDQHLGQRVPEVPTQAVLWSQPHQDHARLVVVLYVSIFTRCPMHMLDYLTSFLFVVASRQMASSIRLARDVASRFLTADALRRTAIEVRSSMSK